MDVVDAIVTVETDSTDEPLSTIGVDVNVIEMTAAQIKALGYEIPRGSL